MTYLVCSRIYGTLKITIVVGYQAKYYHTALDGACGRDINIIFLSIFLTA